VQPRVLAGWRTHGDPNLIDGNDGPHYRRPQARKQ
jgi:hypothetical protein